MTVIHPGPVRTALDCFFSPGEYATAATGRAALGRITYGRAGRRPHLDAGVPRLGVHMAGPGTEPFTEVWTTDRPVRSGSQGGLVYAEDGEHLFCSVRIDEREVYRDTVHTAYRSAFALMRRLGYDELLRMWNLVGAITGPNAEGMENYRDFCAGRARAFEEREDGSGAMPAATGIGALSPGIDLYFLACRAGRTVHLENPRQTPAHRYPREYGPKSPSFARATCLRGADGAPGTVFVSGTASIIGDDTVHADSVEGQCEVTFANIEALVSSENLARHGLERGFELRDLDLVKVYVRDAEHLPVVRALCAEAFPGRVDIAFLNVDVCRPDLLVEIEGICR